MPNLIKTVNFGTNRSGLSTIAYTLINTDGTTKQARTTTGVAETAAGTGIYYCLISFDAAWEGVVLWDDGQATKRYAADTHLRSNSIDEIADAVWDEDITGHTTDNTAGIRLMAIFKYVRSPGFGGGGTFATPTGILTDKEKEKIFKWFDLLIERTKLLQTATEDIISTIKIINKETTSIVIDKIEETKRSIPNEEKIAREISPSLKALISVTLEEFARVINHIDHNTNESEKRFSTHIQSAVVKLKEFSKLLSEEVKVKEQTWDDIKLVIKEQNNTEEILRTLHLFFKDTHVLKEKLDKLFQESIMCTGIISRLSLKLEETPIQAKKLQESSGPIKLPETKVICLSGISQLKNQIIGHRNSNHAVTLITSSGKRIEVPIETQESINLDPENTNISFKREEEGFPAALKQNGIIIVPPHGRWIWEGRKKLIIKFIELKEHIGKPLYLLSGSLAYGIIKLKEPKKISMADFIAMYPKHLISSSERRRWWPFKREFWAYEFDLVRKWDEPRKWKVQKGPQIFVNNVKFEEEEFQTKPEDEPTREESVKIEMKKFGDWYLVKQPKGKKFRYVVQSHVRGDSAHLDLRMEANNHLVGITLNTPEVVEGEKRPQKDLIETKANKFLYPRSPSLGKDFQILTQLKLVQPKVWLKVHGKIPPGGIGASKYQSAEFKILSTGTMQYGCMPAGELISTPNAMIPIEKLQTGDIVLNSKGEPQKILNTFKRKADSIIEINPRHSFKFKVTPNHPLLTIPDQRKNVNDKLGYWPTVKPKFVDADKVSSSYFLCIPKIKKVKDWRINISWQIHNVISGKNQVRKTRNFAVDKNWAWFLGLFLADGYAAPKEVCISGCKKDMLKWDKRLHMVLHSFGKIRWQKHSENSYQMKLNCKPLAQYLRGKFYYNKKKTFPYEALLLEPKLLKYFLYGFVQGDGSESKSGYCHRLTQTSPHAAYGFLLACAKLGFLPTAFQSGKTHQFEWSKRYLKISRRRRTKHKRSAFAWNDNFLFTPIKTIKTLKFNNYVYNFQTADKTINLPIVTHNTQKSDFHEWFITPDGKHEWDKNIKGRWIHAWIPRPTHYKKAGEGKMMWGLFKSNKDTPYVTYHNFETEKKKALKDKIDMVWQHPDGTDLQIVAGKGNLPSELK